jgi:hypothetical protein
VANRNFFLLGEGFRSQWGSVRPIYSNKGPCFGEWGWVWNMDIDFRGFVEVLGVGGMFPSNGREMP